MGSIIGALIGKQIFGQVIGEKGARAIAYLGLFIVIAAILGGTIAFIRHDAVSDHQAHQVQRASKATDQASAERADDTIRNSKSEQEMHDVIQAQPDQAIAPTSRALACERLRRRGNAPASCS